VTARMGFLVVLFVRPGVSWLSRYPCFSKKTRAVDVVVVGVCLQVAILGQPDKV